MKVDIAEHLDQSQRIKSGSYYTPGNLVNKIHNFITPYIKKNEDIVIFDSAGGCGAFLFGIDYYDLRIADSDKYACDFLRKHFNIRNVFNCNSLCSVTREKFLINETDYLIMIGNPPYNDTTSEYKNGQKGKNICDEDLYDRDLGVSFLKSYHKLKADLICILHPLSYLIKKTNFQRLKQFKDNYKLVKGEIFSSQLFQGTGNVKFPILIALYEKCSQGMTFDYIRNFNFNILNSPETFILNKFNTTDGFINKYPPRKNDIKISPIGIYYYTFRDINSLKRNASFLDKKIANGIVVTIDNFYMYSYLYAFKELFSPSNLWLYGNLSPLIDIDMVEKKKKYFVYYSLKTNKTLSKISDSIKSDILHYYQIDKNMPIDNLERILIKYFEGLVS